MTARDFAYWLQGYFELASPEGGLTQEQADTIERHLALVFAHDIDPSAGDADQQAKLNEIHTSESVQEAVKKAAECIAKAEGQMSSPRLDGVVYRC